MNLLQEGGPVFMYTSLLILVISIVLIIKGFTKGDENGNTRKLIGHISLFVLVWGFLGFMIGMIGAFDAISSATDVANSVMAAGLKIALLAPSFGIVVFLIARVGIIGLHLKNK